MTEMIEITVDDALALLEQEVAAEGADFVYDRRETPGTRHGKCLYVERDDQTPSCLIGRCLFSIGVPIETLIELDHCGPIDDEDVDFKLKKAGFSLEPEAVDVWEAAQSVQDSHRPWGQALEAACATARAVGVA